MSFEQNIKKYYVFEFFLGMNFVEATIFLFLQSNNLSYFQILLTQTWFTLVILLLNFPAGIISDLWGRKKVILIGSLAGILGAITYALSSSFYFFLLAETLYGISFPLTFGIISPFVYDSLLRIKYNEHSKKIFSHGSFYFMIGGMIAPVVGSIVATYFSLRTAMFLNIPPFLFCFFIILSSKEPLKVKRKVGHHFFRQMKDSVKFLKNNNLLLFLIIISVSLSSLYYLNMALIQPYMKNIGIDIFWFGFIFSGINLISAILCRESHRIEKKLGFRNTMIVTSLLPTLGFVILGFLFSPVFTILGIALININKRFREPVFNDYNNKLIKTKLRTSVASLGDLIYWALFAFSSPLVGYFSDIYGINNMMIIFSVLAVTLFVVTIFGVYKFDKKTISLLK